MRARAPLIIGLLLRHCGTLGEELVAPQPRDRSQISHSGVNRGLGADRPRPPPSALVFGTVPIIVYKLPRSGSSWFVSLLNQQEGVFLTEEIITGRRGREFSPRVCEQHLRTALQRPMGKVGTGAAPVGTLSMRFTTGAARPERGAARRRPLGTLVASRHGKPSGKHAGDLEPVQVCMSKSSKPRLAAGAECLDIVGFTLNPQRAPDVNYTAVAKASPAARVVVFLRTNRVKAALSRVRGKLLDEVCGYNNIAKGGAKRPRQGGTGARSHRKFDPERARTDPRADRSDGRCRLNASLPLDLDDLRAALRTNFEWEATMLRVAYASGRDVYEITYEDMLGDRDKALGDLFGWCGKEWHGRSVDQYEKATSDDLKALVPNYAELEAFIEAEAPCLLRHLRETRPDVPMDRSCTNPWPPMPPSERKHKSKPKDEESAGEPHEHPGDD